MYNRERIGIGIITCNRKDSFDRLYSEVKAIDYIDHVAVVKNKEFDYDSLDPSLTKRDTDFYQNVKEDVGVGFCKNVLLKELLKSEVDHIFIIEDDINIKNNDVFKVYIDTAKTYKLQHLNFCMAWDSITKKYLVPAYSLKNKNGVILSVFERLCGDFLYFTRECIQQVGLFDAKNYINAMEHAEHTYRIASVGMTLPFLAYADIYKSTDYIEDTGIESSIHHDQASTDLYNKRVHNACIKFMNTYGRSIGQIHAPSAEEVQRFLLEKQDEL